MLVTGVIVTGCEKKVDPVSANGAKVELTNAGAKFVTGDATLNPGDSLLFNFTITTDRPMKFVGVQKNPVNHTAFLSRDSLATTANTYTTTKRFKADTVNGSFTYRFVAYDNKGVYIGHRDIVITITPDFNYFSYRFLYVPDTVAKINKCLFASIDGSTYSYTEGASKSASIDFGYFYDTAKTGSTVNGHTFYALAASTFAPYDYSTWTKNATIMKKITSPSFNSYTSGGILRSTGISNLASGATPKVNQLASGNLVIFKTAAGKYGVAQINFISAAGSSPSVYINVDVKVER